MIKSRPSATSNYLLSDVAVLLAALVLILLVFIGAFYTWEIGDDYLNMVKMRGQTVMGYVWFNYMHWDGKMLSPAGVVLVILLEWANAPVGVVLYLVVYAVCIGLLLRILSYWFQLSNSNFLHMVVLLACFFVGIWPLFKDVVYWLTGGYYSVFLLQGLLLVYFFSKDAASARSGNSNGFSWLKMLLIIVLSLNAQNIILPILFLIGSYTFLQWLFHSKTNALVLASQYLVPIMVGMIITTIAPGNWERLHAEQHTLGITETGFSISAIFAMYLKFSRYAQWGILAGLLFGLTFLKQEVIENSKKTLGVAFFCFAAALVSLVPFFFTPFLARIRVYFFGILFIMIGSMILGMWLWGKIRSSYPRFSALGWVPLLGMIIYGCIFFIGQLNLMIPFSNQVTERKAFLEARRGSTEVVHYPRLILPEDLHLIRWADYKQYGDWDRVKDYFELKEYVEE